MSLDPALSDVRDTLDNFDRAADAIVASIVADLESRPPPSIIYHYTNDVGFRGILESGKIWLTDIFNLNDPSELKHGFSHAVDILGELARADGSPESAEYCKWFEHFAKTGGIQAAAHFFVASFSAVGNDLGQWRAYADNGRGYALGFDTASLEAAFTKGPPASLGSSNTFPIVYDDKKLIKLHRQIIELAFPLISLPSTRGMDPLISRAYDRQLSVLLAMHALRAALFFKHEAYSNEKEYRFLEIYRSDQPAPEVKFRSRSYSLVRYREFDWRPVSAGALKRIVVGPAADVDKASQFARDCLAAFDRPGVPIDQSGIPYRAM
jgi:Protein of unknown function (DUF2971)